MSCENPDPVNILQVDDEAAMILLFDRVLRKIPGINLTSATSAPTALEVARRNPPQLLIMDIKIPRTNGLELTQQIRDEIGKQIPVLFITTSSDSNTELSARAIGNCIDYIIKPFNIAALIATINAFVCEH